MAGVYEFELVHSSKPPSSPPTALKRLAVDSMFGMFDVFYLQATWFYDKPLDAEGIKKTMTALVTELPVLAARLRDEHTLVLSNAGARFSACAAHPGSAYNFTGAYQHMEPKRGKFTDYPSGRISDPLFTVRVTNFVDGTSAIGITSPHKITDGRSYFQVVSAFATAHDMNGSFELVALPDFDCARVWEEAMPTVDSDEMSTKCCWGRVGCITKIARPLFRTFLPKMDQFVPRAKIHLTQAELAELKTAIAVGVGHAVTANEAVSSALLVALAPHWPSLPKTKQGKVAMIVNTQGKGIFKGVKNVAGNFSWNIAKETTKPAREMTMAEAAAVFKAIGDDWRDESRAAKCVEQYVGAFRYMDLVRRLPKEGSKYRLHGDKPLHFEVNNQTVCKRRRVRTCDAQITQRTLQ